MAKDRVDDGLDTCRGIVNGIVLSLPIWAAIIAVVRHFIK